MRVLPALAILLTLLSYRDVIGFDFRPGVGALESWLIRPTGLPFPLALGGALLLLGLRRGRWLALPEGAPGRVSLAAIAFFGSAGLLSWARLTGVADLLIESLALLIVAGAAARKGVAGVRLVAVPAIFLLLALSPSPAAVNELFWFIQVQTARVAAAVLDGFGLPVLRETVVLTTPEETFAVIESCASLGVLVILVAFALLLREQIAERGAPSWGLVIAAVPLAVALNLVRVVTIILRPAANQVSHLVQWGILLGCGVGVLLGVARRVGRPAAATLDGPANTASVRPSPRFAGWAVLAAGLLAILSLLPRPAPRSASNEAMAPAIPLEHAGWSGREVSVDRQFLGWVRFREIVSRRYERESEVVRLFVGLDDSRARSASPFSSKTLLPGFGWIELPAAPQAADSPQPQTAIVVRESARWWVAQWRLGYHGIVGESLRHALAIDASPFAAPRTRAVVRLRVPLLDVDPGAGAAATSTLERFLDDFREFLPLPPDPGTAESWRRP